MHGRTHGKAHGATSHVGAVVLALVMGVGCGGGAESIQEGFSIEASVADDLAALSQETFAVFVAAAPGIEDCVGHPHLEAATDLEDQARYDQAAGTISVRVPATARSLSASLIHELAHHLEVACTSHLALRPRFLAAQGVDQATAWFGDGWAEVPSEQFAEAVVGIVEGRRRRNVLAVPISADALRVVTDWLATGQ